MSGYVTHSSWAVFRWVLVLTLGLMASSCAFSWRVARFYDGPQRPLEEVAVLFTKDPIFAVRIDGRGTGDSLLYGNKTEYHLEPGIHSITGCFNYWNWSGTVGWKGARMTISPDFKSGRVYKLVGDVEFKQYSLDAGMSISTGITEVSDRESAAVFESKLPKKGWIAGVSWKPKVKAEGTIEDIAPRLAEEEHAPPHWREFLKRQLVSKGGQPEQ